MNQASLVPLMRSLSIARTHWTCENAPGSSDRLDIPARNASQDVLSHRTDSHRKRDVTSCRYLFPAFRFAKVFNRFWYCRRFAISSMRSSGRSSRRNRPWVLFTKNDQLVRIDHPDDTRLDNSPFCLSCSAFPFLLFFPFDMLQTVICRACSDSCIWPEVRAEAVHAVRRDDCLMKPNSRDETARLGG
jgi:hypothetical protein